MKEYTKQHKKAWEFNAYCRFLMVDRKSLLIAFA